MGKLWNRHQARLLLARWQETYDIYAPVRMPGDGCFSDTDTVRYGLIDSLEEIVWDQKSDYSFKEALLPISETLFYFTDDNASVPEAPKKKRLIFLRSCEMNALRRLDQMYLNNGPEDFYYKRIRQDARFVLMGCDTPFASCFCASMGTNTCEGYHAYVHPDGDRFYLDIPDRELAACADGLAAEDASQPVKSVTTDAVSVKIPDALPENAATLDLWKDCSSRCISCGRCNFVCPTCTCFTMQDLFYRDNDHGRAGERRRVWASCQVDGYTDMAGGICFRKDPGERMRFKVLHKISDYKKRFGYHMCVGCGRCENICPEYISYTECLNRLDAAARSSAEGGEQ